MKEYQKIGIPFSRDVDGSKKLVEGKFNDPITEYLANNEWFFTEKIDGTNIRVCWDGHEISFLGRASNSIIPEHLLKKLESIFKTDEMEEMFEQIFKDRPTILFGEGYGVKIGDSGNLYLCDDVDFILFDIMIRDVYVNEKAMREIGQSLGLKVVPIILHGTLQDGIDFVKRHPNSTIGAAKMEGLVGKPVCEIYNKGGSRIITKIKWKDFRN